VDVPDGTKLLGVITDRDIAVRCVAEGHPAAECLVRLHMTPAPIDTVKPDADLEDVLALMERDQVHRIPVMEKGALVGVIAGADIARHCGPRHAKQLEELLEAVSAPKGAARKPVPRGIAKGKMTHGRKRTKAAR
ncbi:MAG TPA: CBS domain-containing protein, partial [Dongiaceae bacterium]|nr:CBS domain-containing protein [Dongiaceae bacterium]